MTGKPPSAAPLVLMTMWYVLLGAGSLLWFFIGLMFGSEVFRDRGIPLMEWAMIVGPLLTTAALLISTIVLWKQGRRGITYALFAASLVLGAAGLSYVGGIAI